MAIFARRRLQAMLDELSHLIDDEQARGLVRRIESKEIEQALPAEMELGLSWAIAQLGPVEIEPEWFSETTVPDVFSEHLFPGREAIVEITALSDAVLPADEGMRKASRKLSQEASRIRTGAGRHLTFYFYEETISVGPDAGRRVCVPRNLAITDTLKMRLRGWLAGRDRKEGDRLELREGMLKAFVTWREQRQSDYNFSTSMPPEIRHISDNYVWRALHKKAKQVRNRHFQGIRCVILADVGSTALRRYDERDHSARVFHGSQIVAHYLASQADPGIDVVVIITPNRTRSGLSGFHQSVDWKIGVHCRQGVQVDLSGLEHLAATMPPPRREGYQSRQLHEQAVFAPTAKGRYLGTHISSRKGGHTVIKFSARAFLDLVAGRIPPGRATAIIGDIGNKALKARLDRGETIADLRIESGGLDHDDDFIVFEFKDDPGARPLRVPD